MPNGRTDIFQVKKEDFLVSIEMLNKNEEIGITCEPQMQPVYLSELEERVLGYEKESVVIEEQHKEYYIIHVGNNIHNWVCVTKESQLFPLIKQLRFSKRS
ncbi:hypothetical protein CRENPOLYSF1_810005 [Crenothrix polyspora]|uniref:Uncharacterized protein n=1 Tax=Crenothrix polyspora TaxID=360316 RepID=A0A1R4HI71_9GAMM|nr:hypothetical protein CRENPOLYSF1_810005 [Crenothrix polyspora]